MDGYTLYGFKGSGSAAIEIALERCGVAYRTVDAASWQPGSAVGELEKLNPLKQIPTLQMPDGGVLTESAAIMLHLGLAHPVADILPTQPGPRAQSIRGLVYIAANCYAAISIIDYPERWCADADEAVMERIRRGSRDRLHRHWEIFADLFPARPFLSGARPGGLDFLAAVVSNWSGTRDHLRAARPQLLAALERTERDPAAAAVFRRHWPTG
ncbi:MAG TPA: glutathione S-transferase [Burkholderiaceae bacterium]|nr:glutathione S-transferase [Burkholderiaceae bacterium]